VCLVQQKEIMLGQRAVGPHEETADCARTQVAKRERAQQQQS